MTKILTPVRGEPGVLPPSTQTPECMRLRALVLTLQRELAQDIAHLTGLIDSHAPAAEIAQWQQVVTFKSQEVQSTIAEMRTAGCFITPPPPPPPVVFTEIGPAAIVDDQDKVVGNGAVIDVATHLTDSNVVFAATAGGGVWRTRDARSPAPQWDTTTDGLPSTAMGAVAFAPGDPTGRTVFAGTGTFSSWPSTGPAVGLYRSVDGGDTWQVTGGTALRGRRVRAVLPLAAPNEAVLLVAAYTGSAAGGVFRSTDNGGTFTPVTGTPHEPLPAGDGWAMVEDPVQPGRVYCAVGGSSAGIYRADHTDQGWTRVNTGIARADLTGPVWIRLAVRPPARKFASFGVSTLFAGIVGSDGRLAGLYTAAAGPDVWTSIPLPPGGGAAVNPNGEGSDKFAMAVHPTRPLLFVAGDTPGVWRADVTDPAVPTWTQLIVTALTPTSNVPVGGPHSDYQALIVDGAGGLLVATDGGLYRTPDPEAAAPTWQHIGQTMHINEPLGVAYDTLAGIGLAGSSDNGVAYQQGPGQLQWRSLAGGDGGGVAVDDTAADHSWRYFMNFSGGTGPGGFVVYRAKFDAGNQPLTGGGQLTLADPATPTAVLSGISDADKTQNANYTVNRVAADRLLLGATNVYETRDGGATVNTLLTRPAGTAGGVAMATGGRQDGVDQPDVAYVAMGTRLWQRRPGETGLTELTTYRGGSIRDIAPDVHDWRRAVILDETHVYRRQHDADTFTDCTGNLLGLATDPEGFALFARAVIIRATPTSIREVILVGTSNGLFRTVTGADGHAAIWEKVGNLPHAVVQDMKYHPHRGTHPGGDVLIVGLQGRGCWTLTDAATHL